MIHIERCSKRNTNVTHSIYINVSAENAFHLAPLNDFQSTGELRILQLTWNMEGKCPDDSTNVFDICRSSKHHIIAISTQENSRSILKSMLVESKEKWKRLV